MGAVAGGRDAFAAYSSPRLTLEGRYDDDAKLKQLMRTLDTNGDGVVRAAPRTMPGMLTPVPYTHLTLPKILRLDIQGCVVD